MTTHRETQIEAFRTIMANGLLSRLRSEVYRLVFENQEPDGVTGGELDRLFSSQSRVWSRGASPRLNELVKLGVLDELEPRTCKATGMRVIAYMTNGRLPVARALQRPPLSLREEIREACGLLREPLLDDPAWEERRRAFLARNSIDEAQEVY